MPKRLTYREHEIRAIRWARMIINENLTLREVGRRESIHHTCVYVDIVKYLPKAVPALMRRVIQVWASNRKDGKSILETKYRAARTSE